MLRQTLSVFGLRVLMALVVLATDILVARLLGPEYKGYYYLLVITPILLATVASLGQDYAVNYLGHREPNRVKSVFAAAVVVVLIPSLAFSALLAFASLGDVLYPGLPAILRADIALSGLLIPAESLFAIAGMLLVTIGKPICFGFMRITRRSLVFAGTALLAGTSTLSPGHMVTMLLLIQVVAIGGTALLSMRHIVVLPRGFGQLLRSSIREGLKSYPGRLAERFQARAGIIVLGFIAGGTAVGLFSVALGISELLFFVSSSVATVLFSRKARVGSPEHLRSVRLMLPLALALTVGTAAIGSLIIPDAYGTQFAESVILIWLMTPGSIATAVVQTLVPYMLHNGYKGMVSYAYSIGLLSNIVLIFLLAPEFDVRGAAVATSCSALLSLVTMVIYLVRWQEHRVGDLLFLQKSDVGLLWKFWVGKQLRPS